MLIQKHPFGPSEPVCCLDSVVWSWVLPWFVCCHCYDCCYSLRLLLFTSCLKLLWAYWLIWPSSYQVLVALLLLPLNWAWLSLLLILCSYWYNYLLLILLLLLFLFVFLLFVAIVISVADLVSWLTLKLCEFKEKENKFWNTRTNLIL